MEKLYSIQSNGLGMRKIVLIERKVQKVIFMQVVFRGTTRPIFKQRVKIKQSKKIKKSQF